VRTGGRADGGSGTDEDGDDGAVDGEVDGILAPCDGGVAADTSGAGERWRER